MDRKDIRGTVRTKLRRNIFGIFLLLIAVIVFDAPTIVNRGIDAVNAKIGIGFPKVPARAFQLGLDLQGGAHLTFQANVSAIPEGERTAAVEGVRDVIERRVNGIGVGEPNVQTATAGDTHRVIVELPGVTDVKQAIAMIGATPILEFKEENDALPRELSADEKKELDVFNAEQKKKATSTLERVRKGESFDTVAKEISDDVQSKNNGGYLNYVGSQLVPENVYAWASKAKEGDVAPSVIENMDGYRIMKRGGERDGGEEVRASHILVCYLGARGCEATMTKEEAKTFAEGLYEKANAENFSDLAKEHSVDPGSVGNGGDLGFFGKGSMVRSFEDAVFSAQKGQILGPVESEFGFHIIYKTDERLMKEYELWQIFLRKKTAAEILPPQDPWKQTGLSGKQLKRAEVAQQPQTGEIQVSLQFNDEGTDLFRDITERNIGKLVAIFL
ncbi:MAG: peptidylprolyl isomerase, partial [Patescibacteria group bacterium]